MKILIADDDPDQLLLRATLLERSGHQPFTAITAEQALDCAARVKPECAIVDWRFPDEEGGLALIRALKKGDADIRIFVLTGATPDRFKRLPESELVEEVIAKGASTARLIQKLAEWQLQLFRQVLASTGAITFDVRAMPRSGRSEVTSVDAYGVMKVCVTAAADKGKANEELREVIAEAFGVPKSHVELVLGETSRRKRVRITR